ncbi:MAG: hypothetical protein H6662_10200 [Ardenticatenaceae bacterium]|nr:hypothetical protein [Anaerolineales bacterium]MCB8921946.1 hypothetical protein [Ardenticatenaceae bacterium]MCB8989522.1 hypothetical protein [Ardenticatenaceae bacterium]MCB9003065.1 hypothetical protein [Ardenticatenaceae bacterium]
MTRAITLFLLTSILFLLALPGRTAAQEPLFTSSAEYEFGQGMQFYLVAEDVPQVTAVTLFIAAPEFPTAFSQEVVFEQDKSLVVSHAVDLTQLRLAPFTTVTYWWVLTTETGGLLTVPEQTLVYEDDQFNWQTVTDDSVTVHWTGDDPALGQLALDIIADARPRLQELLPAVEDDALRVYLYPTSADLRAALRLTGRDWVGAHAHPELGVILVTAVNPRTAATDLGQSLPHELVHHLLYRAIGPQYDALPLWLNEGLATLAESAPNPTYDLVLETAVADQTTLPFDQLCTVFPASEADAVLAYAQSYALVQYIQANYGNDALQEMVLAVADGADCDTAVSRTLGLSLEELSQEWLRSEQPRSPFVQFWLENGLVFLLILAGFGVTALLMLSPSRR